MRLFRLVPSILLIGSGVAAAAFFTRAPATDRQVSELSGTIASIDTLSLSVRPDEGSVMTFIVDDPSSLPPGLIAGTRVSVNYETRDGGGRRLLSVGLAVGGNAQAPPPASPSPSAGAEAPAPLPTIDVAGTPFPQTAEQAAEPLAPVAETPGALDLPATLQAPSTLHAGATPATAQLTAARQGPLQLLALVLLLATGAFLLISSWR